MYLTSDIKVDNQYVPNVAKLAILFVSNQYFKALRVGGLSGALDLELGDPQFEPSFGSYYNGSILASLFVSIGFIKAIFTK